MFDRPIDPSARRFVFTFDDRSVEAREGDSVAAALFAEGLVPLRRTPASGAARAPYCMMGACFDCLVVIDDVGNRQACMTTARPGMRVETQKGARELGR